MLRVNANFAVDSGENMPSFKVVAFDECLLFTF